MTGGPLFSPYHWYLMFWPKGGFMLYNNHPQCLVCHKHVLKGQFKGLLDQSFLDGDGSSRGSVLMTGFMITCMWCFWIYYFQYENNEKDAWGPKDLLFPSLGSVDCSLYCFMRKTLCKLCHNLGRREKEIVFYVCSSVIKHDTCNEAAEIISNMCTKPKAMYWSSLNLLNLT